MNTVRQKLVFFGVGATARWVAQLAKARYQLFGTTRDAKKIEHLQSLLIEPKSISVPMTQTEREHLLSLTDQANVLVSFPPDGYSDLRAGPLGSRG